jgi:hypothetical protein
MRALSNIASHTDWRRWVKDMLATILPLQDDKYCEILIVMRELHLHSNLFPKTDDQISDLLKGAYRAAVRSVAIAHHGRNQVDLIMDAFDFLQESATSETDMDTGMAGATRSAAAKASTIEGATAEEAALAASTASRVAKQLDTVLALANAQINAHCVAAISKHLDPALLATVCNNRTTRSLLSTLKERFASTKARKSQIGLFTHLLKKTRFVHTAYDYFLLLQDAGVVLTTDEEQDAIETLSETLAVRTPFTICVNLHGLNLALSASKTLPDFISSVHTLEKENDKMNQKIGLPSEFPSHGTSECQFKLTGENPFDNERLLYSETFDLRETLKNHRGPQAADPAGKGQRQPTERGAIGGPRTTGPAASSPTVVSDDTGATFNSGDGARRCTLCTSSSCSGASTCTSVFDPNHMGS